MRHRLTALTTTFTLAGALLAGAVQAQFGPIDATGLVPLNDLGLDQYAGYQGGLYQGANMRPPEHNLAGLQQATKIQPLDHAGNPDPEDGRIVVLTTGMSNAKIISKHFKLLADADPARSTHVKVVNGGHAGKTAELMSDPTDPFWNFLRKDLKQAGVTPEQVQVVWMLQTQKLSELPFPEHAESLADQLEEISRLMKTKFSNLRLMYLSSRIYGGHDTNGKSPEPHAYQSGFGVKWVIQRQIAGEHGLNYDPSKGAVLAPWMAWGPYLWADGTIERSDGTTWMAGDFSSDGLHPSHIGSIKAAEMVLDFFQTDATTRPWYMREQWNLCPTQAVTGDFGSSRGAPERAAPRLGTSMLPIAGATQPLKLYVRGAPSGAPGWFIVGEPMPGGAGTPVAGGMLYMDLGTARIEAVTTNPVGQAWMSLGQLPEVGALTCGAGLYAQFVVWTGQGYSFSRPVALLIGH